MADNCRCADMPLVQHVPGDPIPYQEPCPSCRARQVRQDRAGALSTGQVEKLESLLEGAIRMTATPTDDLRARQVIADAIKLATGGSFNTPADVADWLRDELAALSALPAGGEWLTPERAMELVNKGWEPPEPRPVVAALCKAIIHGDTTPPADAEVLGPHPLNICPKCGDYCMDCECPADAAVGAQGEDIDAVVACLEDDAAAMFDSNADDERAHNMQQAANLIRRLAAPAAGKGVDDAMRKRASEWLAANNGYWDDYYVERLLRAILPTAALNGGQDDG